MLSFPDGSKEAVLACHMKKDGKIIQRGNHEKLVKEKGYYKEIFKKQLTKKDG